MDVFVDCVGPEAELRSNLLFGGCGFIDVDFVQSGFRYFIRTDFPFTGRILSLTLSTRFLPFSWFWYVLSVGEGSAHRALSCSPRRGGVRSDNINLRNTAAITL